MNKSDLTSFQKPRNIVTRSGGILRGEFSSCRYKKQIKWEECIEKDAVALLEFSSHVRDVVSQPFRANFVDDGKSTSRTPDFLVTTFSEKIILECKPKSTLLDPLMKEHLAVAKKHFESFGYRYHIVTDESIRTGHALRNARRLLRYRVRPLQPKHETRRIHLCLDRLQSKFSSLTLSQAANILESEVDAWVLIASGAVHVDFRFPINADTRLFFEPLEENQDASSFLFN